MEEYKKFIVPAIVLVGLPYLVDGHKAPFRSGLSPAQLVVWKATVVGTANQPHASRKLLHTPGRMTAARCQASQALSKGRMQAFDERRI